MVRRRGNWVRWNRSHRLKLIQRQRMRAIHKQIMCVHTRLHDAPYVLTSLSEGREMVVGWGDRESLLHNNFTADQGYFTGIIAASQITHKLMATFSSQFHHCWPCTLSHFCHLGVADCKMLPDPNHDIDRIVLPFMYDEWCMTTMLTLVNWAL